LLIVTPYYSKPTQEGLLAHFRAVAATTDLPVMLYDIPGRSSIAIAPDTYARLAEDAKFVAIKDAVGDIFRGVSIAQRTGLALYSGDDVLNLAWLAHGAAGVVSVVGHVTGEHNAAMVAAVDRGDMAEARRLYERLIPVIDVIMHRAQGAMTAKAAMQLMGVIEERTVRLPLVPASDELVDEIRDVLHDLGVLSV
jgi:4-hydroxy-tetrahydrodipicolinate synthase